MSYALRHGEHVRVDVMFAGSLRKQGFRRALSSLILMAISLIIILAFDQLRDAVVVGRESSANPVAFRRATSSRASFHRLRATCS